MVYVPGSLGAVKVPTLVSLPRASISPVNLIFIIRVERNGDFLALLDDHPLMLQGGFIDNGQLNLYPAETSQVSGSNFELGGGNGDLLGAGSAPRQCQNAGSDCK